MGINNQREGRGEGDTWVKSTINWAGLGGGAINWGRREGTINWGKKGRAIDWGEKGRMLHPSRKINQPTRRGRGEGKETRWFQSCTGVNVDGDEDREREREEEEEDKDGEG